MGLALGLLAAGAAVCSPLALCLCQGAYPVWTGTCASQSPAHRHGRHTGAVVRCGGAGGGAGMRRCGRAASACLSMAGRGRDVRWRVCVAGDARGGGAAHADQDLGAPHACVRVAGVRSRQPVSIRSTVPCAAVLYRGAGHEHGASRRVLGAECYRCVRVLVGQWQARESHGFLSYYGAAEWAADCAGRPEHVLLEPWSDTRMGLLADGAVGRRGLRKHAHRHTCGAGFVGGPDGGSAGIGCDVPLPRCGLDLGRIMYALALPALSGVVSAPHAASRASRPRHARGYGHAGDAHGRVAHLGGVGVREVDACCLCMALLRLSRCPCVPVLRQSTSASTP